MRCSVTNCVKNVYLTVKHHGHKDRHPYCWDHGQVFRKVRRRGFMRQGVWVQWWENDGVQGVEAKAA